MKKKETMLYDLQSETLFVSKKEQVTLPTQDSGTVDEDVMKHAKYACVMGAMKYVANHLVRTKRSYPRMDEIDVDMEVDFVVIPAITYKTLIQHLNE